MRKPRIIVFDANSCVDRFEEEAFSDCQSLKSIIIPKSVKSIGALCFDKCPKLKSINLRKVPSWNDSQ
ncbi:MAG: leucine-rich repeat domain-containing protein [Holosporaceae bacterium]|nr:leucine-rich repeat domain-containing protein [Holosporaceae bacterium]